ncbi:MAG: flavodoxin family protein [Deferribacterota bacterium]|nr:flavodoxin family protein [Deferribacterota bacterium]
MKVIGISGSPRKDRSNTSKIIKTFLKGVEEENVYSKFIDITERDIKYCIGCDNCHKLGRCVLKDELNDLVDILYEADAFVIGSPVYVFQVSAQLKTFIDRLTHQLHCQRFLGKKAVVVTTSGGGYGEKEVINYLKDFLNMTGVFVVSELKKTIQDTKVLIDNNDEFLAYVRKEAKKFVSILKGDYSDQDQLEKMKNFRDIIGAVIKERRDDWPFEYEYFLKKGWFNS